MRHRLLVAAAVSGAVAVALGAFGAHALDARLDGRAGEAWATASQYHFVHTLALLALAGLPARVGGRLPAAAGALWLAGIVVFSGSLYALALTGLDWLGAVTPLGGVALIAGWLVLAAAGVRAGHSSG